MLLAEPEAAPRVALIAALRSEFEVLVVEPGQDPLPLARSLEPSLVVLGVARAQPLRVLRACRAIKTELPRLRVGVLNGPGVPVEVEVMTRHYLADGVIVGPTDPEAVRIWVRRLLAGEKAVVRAPDRGTLRALKARLFLRG